MDKFDEPEGFFDAPRRETRPPSEYDPLHSPWDDDLRYGDITAGDDDYLFAVRPAPVDDDHYIFNRYQRDTAVTYPHRYHPLYEERLTELQRRLRDETITLPKHERRWTVTVVRSQRRCCSRRSSSSQCGRRSRISGWKARACSRAWRTANTSSSTS